MKKFAILAATALLIASSAKAHTIPATEEPTPYFIDASTVMRVTCSKSFGSAFYIGGGKFVTAQHVITNTNCKVNEMPIKITDFVRELDFTMFTANVKTPYRVIMSCEGFKEGQNYYAVGYAEGRTWPVVQRLVGTSHKLHQPKKLFDKTTFLRGSAVKGMSGGPVFDEDGVVVGIVSHHVLNGVSEADVLALADTPICKR